MAMASVSVTLDTTITDLNLPLQNVITQHQFLNINAFAHEWRSAHELGKNCGEIFPYCKYIEYEPHVYIILTPEFMYIETDCPFAQELIQAETLQQILRFIQ